MSVKFQKYSAEFKTKVVLDLLSGDFTLAQICAKYKISNKTVTSWKKTFMLNANLAFNKDLTEAKNTAVIAKKDKEINELHRQLGKRTAELEWAAKKLKSLDFNQKKNLIESELKDDIPVYKRCELLGFNRSSYYYNVSEGRADKLKLLKAIDKAYESAPFYGYRKIHRQLIEEGYEVGANRVNGYMKELGLQAIYPRQKKCTTLPDDKKKYPYLLRDLEISYANQVWSTDITYVRVNGGFVYLAAVIDWYSKAILSWKVSNTMDTGLVMDVLRSALKHHGHPEIFNTDQGSQYTSLEHTEHLAKRGIKISMDGKGRATDNIAIERFWRSAKYEDIYLRSYKTMKELKLGIKEYMDFYNYNRFHQSLAYKKPMEVYLKSKNEPCKKAA